MSASEFEPVTAAASSCFGKPVLNADLLILTIVLLRRCAIRFRPIRAVGNDSSARRVDSMVPDARTTAQVGGIVINFCCPSTQTSSCVTAPFVTVSLVTCARGTRKSRRRQSGLPVSWRIASIRIGALEYLSKLNRPDAGGSAWTASGAYSIASTVGTVGAAARHLAF